MILRSLLAVGFALLVSIASAAGAEPVVSNVQGLQRPGTKLVDISYDVTADTPTVAVTLRISSDGGATFEVPATTLSGAVGPNVPVGTGKVITWNAGTDWLGNYSTAMRFEVTADDGVVTAPDGFVYVAAGSLPESSWAGPQDVEGFFMGKTEVTYGEFEAVRTWAAANGYDIDWADLEAVKAWASANGYTNGRTNNNAMNGPATYVSWYQSLKWCNARSEKEGLRPVYKVGAAIYRTGESVPTIDTNANGCRLPSEKEWEFAARGGIKTNGYIYSGSNDNNAVAWTGENSSDGDKEVSTKNANELGLWDMSGNAWEWCFDNHSDRARVLRGGSWFFGANLCRIDYRHYREPSLSFSVSNFSGDPSFGFRIARSITP